MEVIRVLMMVVMVVYVKVVVIVFVVVVVIVLVTVAVARHSARGPSYIVANREENDGGFTGF